MMETKTDITIKYGGQDHQIDANTLINSLIHTTNILKEINSVINVGNSIEIKIKPFEKGSFLLHIELVEITKQVVAFTVQHKEEISAVVGAFIGVLKLKKFLKSSQPKSIESTNNNGSVTLFDSNNNSIEVTNITYNIYQNPTIQEAVAKNFETLENDPAIESFEILDEDKNTLEEINKSEFQDLSIISEEVSKDEKKITEIARLHIITLSFEGSAKWGFLFKGNRINASVSDSDFRVKIDKGESFAKGDILSVELSITQKFDSSVDAYINKSYSVIRIIDHIKKGAR